MAMLMACWLTKPITMGRPSRRSETSCNASSVEENGVMWASTSISRLMVGSFSRSIGVAGADQGLERHQDDPAVKEQGPVVDVMQVVDDAGFGLAHRVDLSAQVVDLRPPGEPRPHPVAGRVTAPRLNLVTVAHPPPPGHA